MRPIILAVTGLTAIASVGFLTDRAGAASFGSPAALIGAAEELALVEAVHCRPGRWHHVPNRWRKANGCPRRGAAVIVVPGRERYVVRDGVRVRVGTEGVRSRTTVRSGTSTTIRSGGGA